MNKETAKASVEIQAPLSDEMREREEIWEQEAHFERLRDRDDSDNNN